MEYLVARPASPLTALSDKLQPPSALLKTYLQRKKTKNPKYSMRALARDLKLSPGFMSSVLKGDKNFPLKRLTDLCRVLDLDVAAKNELKRSLLIHSDHAQARELVDLLRSESKTPTKKLFPDMVYPTYNLLENWYNIALMDLASCVDFRDDAKWIAERLSISPEVAERAFKRLVQLGVLVKIDGRWQKHEDKVRFPTTASDPRVREFHKQMMQKALTHMMKKTDAQGFAERLVTGITIAVNSKNLDKAKVKIFAALQDIADTLCEGDSDEVYQLNVQLFPLTEKGES